MIEYLIHEIQEPNSPLGVPRILHAEDFWQAVGLMVAAITKQQWKVQMVAGGYINIDNATSATFRYGNKKFMLAPAKYWEDKKPAINEGEPKK